MTNSTEYNDLYVPAVLASHRQPIPGAKNSTEVAHDAAEQQQESEQVERRPVLEDRLGGNAALMAVQAVKFGARVLAGGYMGKETRRLLLSNDPY